MTWGLALVALVALGVAGISARLRGTPVTAQMIFLAAGVFIGPAVLGAVNVHGSFETTKSLAEATLAIVLFNDASRVNLHELRSELRLPARLLGVGLPLTILLGALIANGIFGSFKPAEGALLAVLLAPTDAALGQAVVEDIRLPVSIRQGLNVESGLNDGICVPILYVFLAAADVEVKALNAHQATTLALEQIGFGLAAGLAAGVATAWVLREGRRRKLITASWEQVIPVAGAALAYGTAVSLGGSGFIAAFIAGAVFGRMLRGSSAESDRFSEELGSLLGGLTFVLFGAVLLGPELGQISWQIVLYALLSLTVVRMLPVAIALSGTRSRRPTVAFIGWFGPRGLASIVFAAIVVGESHVTAAQTIALTAYVTIAISTFAHGLSAAPLTARYARWLSRNKSDLHGVEVASASELRPKGPAALATPP